MRNHVRACERKRGTATPITAVDIIAAMVQERDVALAVYVEKQNNLINAMENYLVSLRGDRETMKGGK